MRIPASALLLVALAVPGRRHGRGGRGEDPRGAAGLGV
jgi:hypothetical protein